MKKSKAITKYVRISPRKARLSAGLIRWCKVEEAILQLQFGEQKGDRLLLKTLKSAVANAETIHGVQRRDLKVDEVFIGVGPTIKRAKPKNRGGRVPILKRMSHLTVVVAVEEEGIRRE